jgi:hypothetical protein
MEVARVVLCGACGLELNASAGLAPEDRSPCPSCGSTDRRVEQVLADGITLGAMLSLKARDASGRWFVKQKVGDSFFRLSGRWHRLQRLLDRQGDRYFEHIEDAETGEVVEHVEERLSDHRGHGDDIGPRRS